MDNSVLADHFEGAGAKYLTEVEVNRLISNQHEFQGVSVFRDILGTDSSNVHFDATFYWLSDDEDEQPVTINTSCTWYDARSNQPHRSPEFRLYYTASSEPVVSRARAGDLLVVAKTKEQKLHIFLCPANTTIEQQLRWLFDLNPTAVSEALKFFDADNSVSIGFAARSVLEDIGIELDEPVPNAIDQLISRYGNGFPTAKEFSQFARDTVVDADPMDSPDNALTLWMDHEERLFRHLERHLVSERLKTGFMEGGEADVEGFIEFSLSVQNRRKSRAGFALEYHIEELLKVHDIRYARYARPKIKGNPDFLFPGEIEYRDPSYDAAMLTMLGAKRSCKERWRQVLAEAPKIKDKHLLTLQPSISESQTNEMKSERLQLIVPRSIFHSYHQSQREWLVDVAEFITLVKTKQQAGGNP